ncbi:PilZ domain protein [Polystyrenella longa]|uniref:PilZ domain protein n=1 Tax=Polystyrenella longa TaxID=2528007 RepID=A0A518CTU8_9PLAN|nr:PilZ domain-containing protein [Polystyrenella longa]QDU82653.1 PilZ domain protein [Polystyrenella longa]
MDESPILLDKTAIEILDMLDRWSDKMRGHHSQKREYPRVSYRTRMTVFSADSESRAGEAAENTSFTVWSRNLSRGGVGFLYHNYLENGKYLLCLDPLQEGQLWFLAEIVRSRKVHNNFWEYGAKLLERASI